MTDEKKASAGGDESSRDDSGQRLSDAREKFGKVVSTARKNTRNVRKGAERAGEKLKERAEKASHVAREKMDSAREGVRHGYEKVTKDLDQLGQDVNEYVRHNPGRAVAIALGVGFLLGVLLRPRRD